MTAHMLEFHHLFGLLALAVVFGELASGCKISLDFFDFPIKTRCHLYGRVTENKCDRVC